MTTTTKVGLPKFQPGYRKFYLDSLKDYSRKIINTQIDNNKRHTWKYIPLKALKSPWQNTALFCPVST